MDEPPTSTNAPTSEDELRYERDRIAWNLPSPPPPPRVVEDANADEPEAAERPDLKPAA